MEIRNTNSRKMFTNTGARIEGKLSMHPTTATLTAQSGMSELFVHAKELGASITKMFQATFADYQGTNLIINPNSQIGTNLVEVTLVFKLMSQDQINALPDDGKFVAFNILGANLHQQTRNADELFDKINIRRNVQTAYNRGGSKYAVGITQEAKDILSDFLLFNSNLNYDWDKQLIVRDSIDRQTRAEQTQVGVTGMNILKIIAATRGHKDDTSFGYSIAVANNIFNVAQQLNMNAMQNMYTAMKPNDPIFDIRELDATEMQKVIPDNNVGGSNFNGGFIYY